MPVVPSTWEHKEKDSVFKASLGYIVSLSQNQKRKENGISALKIGIIIKLLKKHYV